MYYNGRYVRRSTGKPAVENMDDEEVIVTTSGSHLKKYYDGEPKTVEKMEKKKEARCPYLNRKCTDNCAWYDSGKCGKITGAAVKLKGICPMSGASARSCSEACPLYSAGHCAVEGSI